ncbi:MAG: hypothetical protein ACLQCB_21670 [Spirochaetia bacterium]
MTRYSALTAAYALLALIAAVSAYGQTVSLPQPEAPTTIFSSKLGSADVDLTLQGSWNASLGFTTGLLFAPGLPVQALDSFPGLAPGFVFTQAPDLTISLYLMRKYFLDVSVLSAVQNNTIRMGYKGDSDEVLRSLVIGNTGISIPPSPFLEIPAQPTSSIGASAELVSGSSTNDLLLRWDSTAIKHKTFVGKNELIDQHIGVESYTKGRYFFLPDVGIDVGSLVVYLEDKYGTVIGTDSAGHASTYRLATLTDVTIDTTNGLVSLKSAVKGRVVVYYTVGGTAVGASTIGNAGIPRNTDGTFNFTAPLHFFWTQSYMTSTFQTRQVNLQGVGTALMIWQPGDNTPFEIDNSYAFANTPPTDPSKIGYQFEATAAGAQVPTGYAFRTVIGESRYQVQMTALPRNFQDFYPFYALDPSNLLYGPNRDELSGEFKFDMHVQFVAPITSFTLEQNIVPGSVQVTINGITETRFSVDAASGNLTFQVPIQPTDQIDVTYRLAEQGLSGGDILFAWEDKIDLKNNLFLTFSAGLRWNADPWTFTQEAYSKSGTVIAAAELQGKEKNYSWMAQGAVSFTDPDTTGILRLFGMEGNAINLDISEDQAYPASLPLSQESAIGSLSLSQSNRGYLYYTDFRQYGALGSYTLEPINWSGAPSPLPYTNGSRMGPFNVLGSSQGSTSGTSLVMQYQLDASNVWVGTQLPISPGTDVDLSSARSITIRLQGYNITAQTNVYVQIGSISEDLDGSGILKAKVSSADAGFPFTDSNPNHGNISLLVGAGPKLQGNGKLDSEDRNANGVLDQEDPSRVVTIGPTGSTADETGPLSLAPGTSGWTAVTVALSDQDRAKLLQARGIRIILVANIPGGSASGYVLIDSISVEATPFWVNAALPPSTDRSNITAQEIQEQFAPSDPGAGNRLPDKFSQKLQQFHPNGEEQDVLEVQWGSSTAVQNPFSVRGFTTQGTGGIKYQSVVAYVRMPTPATPGTTFDFTLYDSGGLGVHWQLNDTAFAGNVWHEMKVSRIDSTVKIDGNTVGQPIKFDSTTGDITQLQISVAATTSSANPPPSPGLFFIDEVYFTDPQGSFGGAFTGSFAGQVPGVVLKAGNVAILSNLSIQQDVTAMSAGFSSLYGVPSAAESMYSRTEVGGDVLVAHVQANVTVREAAGSVAAFGGHKVTVPAVVVPLTVMDAFSLDGGGGFSREDRVDLGPVVATTFSADSQAALDPTTGLLTQTWLGHLSIAPPIPLNLSSDLQLSQSLLGYALSSENYWTQWTQGFDLVVPWQGGLDYARMERLSTRLGVPATPVGFDVEASTQAQGSNYALPAAPGPYTQEDDAQLSTALLFKLGQGDSTLSVGYKRLLSVITTPMPGPRFVAETDQLLSVLSQQGYMLTSIPVLELFTDNTSAILPIWQSYGATTQASYNPAFTLGVKRNYGSRLLDVFLPSSADLSVGQMLRLASSISETDIYITLATASHAVNLFGRLGSIPRLPMITTDEYSINLSGSVAGNSAQSLRFTEATAVASASLLGEKDTGLTFADSFKWDQDPTTLQISLTNSVLTYLDWSVFPDGGINVPYLSAALGKDAHIAHRESGSFAVNYNPGNDYHPATILLGHATSLVFPEHGTIKGSVNVGADTETALTPGLIWRLAVSFGIEAKLTF